MKSASLVSVFASLLVTVFTSACQTTKPEQNTVALVPVNSFARTWTLPLNLDERRDSLRSLHLRDDMLFAYSARNRVTVMSAAEGRPLYALDITPDGVPIKPPVIVKENIAFPSGSSIEIYSKAGKFIDSANTKRSIRSAGTALENTIYLGLDYPAGGRLAAIDLTRKFDRARWELMTRHGISSAPAVYQNLIYFADEGGAVFAVSEDKGAAWPLDSSKFQTDGRIVADVKADDGGVYVASMDSKLYCLEQASGRLRWQYYGTRPLTDSPIITADTVYQVVPGVGVAAINKIEGDINRQATWTAKGAKQFVSQDQDHCYLVGANNQLMAVDRKSGELKFKSQRRDLVEFATNTKDATIYAATRNGTVMAVKPITTPGTMGTIVFAPVELDEVLVLWDSCLAR